MINFILEYQHTAVKKQQRICAFAISCRITDCHIFVIHYNDVIMTMMASQITSLTVVYSIVYSGRSKKTSKLCVTGLCAGNSPGPVNSPHKGPVTRKMFPFDDVIMQCKCFRVRLHTPQCPLMHLLHALNTRAKIYLEQIFGDCIWNKGAFTMFVSYSLSSTILIFNCKIIRTFYTVDQR